MDPVYLIWLFAIGALVGGGIIGAIVYRNLAPDKKETEDLRAELDATRQEIETYKTSVNSHFDKTAELVNELTQDYVKVYQHLAQGAQSLGDARDFINLLEQHPGEVPIAVDDEAAVQDTKVSELSAVMPEQQETFENFSARPDEVKIPQNALDGGNETDAKIGDTGPADENESHMPVTDVDEPSTRHDDSDVRAKAAADSGHDSATGEKAVDTDPEKNAKKVAEPA